jgi:DNA-directed RNA polymerase subunit M/transcription elongation factor TFIIS
VFKYEIIPEHDTAQQELNQIDYEATRNTMLVNYKKTMALYISSGDEFTSKPRLFLGGFKIKTVPQTKILGYWLTDDMKTRTNTDAIIAKAKTQMWRIWRLKKLEANPAQMLTVLQRYILPHLELSAPMWHFLITKTESKELEDVLKMAVQAILGEKYGTYPAARKKLGMTTLTDRRVKLTKKFAIESYSHHKFGAWYKRVDENQARKATRLAQNPNLVMPARTNDWRLERSAIPQFIHIINENRDQIRADLARMYTCSECPVTADSTNRFKSRKEFIKHRELKHKLSKFNCFTCEMTLPSKPALNEHINALHAPKTTCQICRVKADTEELMAKHLRTHPFRVDCTHCGTTLANWPTLRQHMYKHHELEMVPCDQCGTRWTSKTAMRQHKDQDHKDHKDYTEFSPGQPGHNTVALIITHNLSLSMNEII